MNDGTPKSQQNAPNSERGTGTLNNDDQVIKQDILLSSRQDQFDPIPEGNSDANGIEYQEEDYEKESRKRSEKNRIYGCMYKIVTSVAFNFFIFCLILANTFTLAAYTYDQSDTKTDVLKVFNEFFTWAFFLEMIMKIIGLGFSNYRKDSYNVFDAVIVVISLIDWAMSRIPGLNAGSALNAFRALRLLRMMKLSKSWKALQILLGKM